MPTFLLQIRILKCILDDSVDCVATPTRDCRGGCSDQMRLPKVLSLYNNNKKTLKRKIEVIFQKTREVLLGWYFVTARSGL